MSVSWRATSPVPGSKACRSSRNSTAASPSSPATWTDTWRCRAARHLQVSVQVAGEEGDAAVEFLEDLQAFEPGTGEVALQDTDMDQVCLQKACPHSVGGG